MANLIIKPTSGGSLVLQDEGGDAAVTVGTTGSATFAQNATFSGTANNLGTVTAGTMGTGITFPSGTRVGGTILKNLDHTVAHISSSTNDSYLNTGISGSYAPVKSSSATYLLVHFRTGMQQYGTNVMMTDCTMNDTDTTTFALGDGMGTGVYGSGSVYTNRQQGSNNECKMFTFLHNGVATGGMATSSPTNLTSYTAGTTYYFRMYWQCNSSTSYFVHSDSYYIFWLEEVMR